MTQKISIPKEIYKPRVGSIGCLSNPRKNELPDVEWYGCRESFHGSFTDGDWLGYSKSKFLFRLPNDFSLTRFRAFFKEVENRLKLKTRTTFVQTTSKDTILVIPARWWLMHGLRFGLMTILLRSGSNYHIGMDFETTLYSYNYASETKEAIEKFFQGNTFFKGSKISYLYPDGHWRSIFRDKTNLKILCDSKPKIKPKKTKKNV